MESAIAERRRDPAAARVPGANTIWFTFGVYKILALIFAFSLLKYSERSGIIFQINLSQKFLQNFG